MTEADPTTIRRLFEYMRWADRDVLAAAEALAEDAYHREQSISHGSVHKLLVHCVAAQWTWLSRWNGHSPPRLPGVEEFPTRQDVARRWPQVHGDLFAFLDRQTPASLAHPVAYQNTRGQSFSVPLARLMLHVVDHATYHRGLLNSMIKLAGGRASTASLLNFWLDGGGGRG